MVAFSSDRWKVRKGALVVTQGVKIGTLYMMESTRDIVAIAIANPWHRRLGDMSEKGIKVLLSNEKLQGLKSTI